MTHIFYSKIMTSPLEESSTIAATNTDMPQSSGKYMDIVYLVELYNVRWL